MTYLDPKLSEFTYGPSPSAPDQEQLINSHLPLVRKLAWHVHSRISMAIEIEDLLQIGMVTLVEAAQGFEDRGLGFTNYAKLRVRGAMIDQLRKQSSISRSAMQFQKQLRETQEDLAQKLGHTPSQVELAAAMNMDQQSFETAKDNAEAIELQSMDEVYSDQNIWFSDATEKADDRVERHQRQKILADAIDSLPEREGLILQLYFIEEMNLEEIGQTLDIGASRVCQIKKAALEKLHKLLAHSE
ncbi:FliA/WhiG family RNA polymerase sigma factor [Parasphingorhabdus cellanae]|uniref:FliA/WhiG family RNA polymerase sigma factor n=1 Tax=Parasphingorhabdus cellanae TaxID=2806553 RepID=A0ABX7T4H8_9SPHN|nr:FliA/WhiG family RNA polymerase sigma factor [Parasphingorhabdus cellanae]QTD56485.1 FliA/WhiG family RNA polymerase sigma factor [Parasphingorhabdus cellanae]